MTQDTQADRSIAVANQKGWDYQKATGRMPGKRSEVRRPFAGGQVEDRIGG